MSYFIWKKLTNLKKRFGLSLIKKVAKSKWDKVTDRFDEGEKLKGRSIKQEENKVVFLLLYFPTSHTTVRRGLV
jgi:hypothetical protein